MFDSTDTVGWAQMGGREVETKTNKVMKKIPKHSENLSKQIKLNKQRLYPGLRGSPNSFWEKWLTWVKSQQPERPRHIFTGISVLLKTQILGGNADLKLRFLSNKAWCNAAYSDGSDANRKLQLSHSAVHLCKNKEKSRKNCEPRLHTMADHFLVWEFLFENELILFCIFCFCFVWFFLHPADFRKRHYIYNISTAGGKSIMKRWLKT